MRSEQRQPARDSGRMRTFLCFGAWVAIEQCAQIAIAQTVDGELAPQKRGQKRMVVRLPGIEWTVAAALLHHRLAKLGNPRPERVGATHVA